jgi:tRNA wybutosine-synthesizing protein 3
MNDIEKITFENIKIHHTQTLKDAIEKKEADKDIIPFLLEITKIKDVFTSSSCSGRIALLSSDINENKKYTSFHKRYHRQITFEELLKDINGFNEGYLWLKVEPFIFHFGVKDLVKATELLSFLRNHGLKRAAIISTKKGKIVVEATNTVFLSTLVKKNEHLLVSKDYLQEIVVIANHKFKENELKRKNFEKEFLTTFLK